MKTSYFVIIIYAVLSFVLSSCVSSIKIHKEYNNYYHARLTVTKDNPKRAWPKIKISKSDHEIKSNVRISELKYEEYNKISQRMHEYSYWVFHPIKKNESFTIDVYSTHECRPFNYSSIRSSINLDNGKGKTPKKSHTIRLRSGWNGANIVYTDRYWPSTIRIDFVFIDPETDMPIEGAIVSLRNIPLKSNVDEFRKKFPSIKCPNKWKNPFSDQSNTNNKGFVKFGKIRLNMDNSVEFELYARTHGRAPIKMVIKENSINEDLSYKIEWPINPINVKITDGFLSPKITKQ